MPGVSRDEQTQNESSVVPTFSGCSVVQILGAEASSAQTAKISYNPMSLSSLTLATLPFTATGLTPDLELDFLRWSAMMGTYVVSLPTFVD